MSQPRLNHVMVLSIYKELLDELDLYAVANEFVGSSEYRLRLLNSLVPSLRDKLLEIDLLNTKSLQQSIRIVYLKTYSQVHAYKSWRVVNNEQKWVGN